MFISYDLFSVINLICHYDFKFFSVFFQYYYLNSICKTDKSLDDESFATY